MPAGNTPAVNFNYAFAPPHRITVALPDSSNKTLLDAMPGKLRMSWTYEDLLNYSFNSFPHSAHEVESSTLSRKLTAIPLRSPRGSARTATCRS